MKKVIIATRGSILALWQAEHIKSLLQGRYPGLEVDLLKIKTTGDKILDVPLAKVGGKGLFVKEIEEALLDGRADLAVHSMKDVPTELPAELIVGVNPVREAPTDSLLSVKYDGLDAAALAAEKARIERNYTISSAHKSSDRQKGRISDAGYNKWIVANNAKRDAEIAEVDAAIARLSPPTALVPNVGKAAPAAKLENIVPTAPGKGKVVKAWTDPTNKYDLQYEVVEYEERWNSLGEGRMVFYNAPFEIKYEK